jgi:hypothetical protein
MKPRITETKLLFSWLMSFVTFLLPLSAVLVIQHVEHKMDDKKSDVNTFCVGVQTPAGATCLASRSNGDILEQKNNHIPY